jgi:hypothetical protein
LDFDRGLDVRSIVSDLRARPPEIRVAGTFISDVQSFPCRKEVVLKAGEEATPFVELESAVYNTVCESSPSPWVSPFCRREAVLKISRRVRVVLSEPRPEEWGDETFHLTLDVMRRPELSVESANSAHHYSFQAPGELSEDILATPLPAVRKPSGPCLLRSIEDDRCVYRCSDGSYLRRPVAAGEGSLLCPQVYIPI